MLLIGLWDTTDNRSKQELVGDAGIGEFIHVPPNMEGIDESDSGFAREGDRAT
jgi:hypothetical protein